MHRFSQLCLSVATLAVIHTAASAAPVATDQAAILAAHNRLRAELSIAPLRWSDRLAQGAAQWAKTVASRNQLQHSGEANVGENIAVGWGTQTSLPQMLSIWANEKTMFQRGMFPQVSRDGSEASVLHYSQMIWRGTTEIGCGTAANGRMNFLVCWYSPQGNYIGQSPY
ncbi:MAG TPA: CAP domain-containing protein [Rhizomicrobium sp.]